MANGRKHFTIGPYASNDDSSSKEDLSINSFITVRGHNINNANSLGSNPSFSNIVGQAELDANGSISTITTGFRSGSWHNFADYPRSSSPTDAIRDTRDFASSQLR